MKLHTTFRTLCLLTWSAAAVADSVRRQEFPAYPGLPDGVPSVSSVSVSAGDGGLRRYSLSTTARQREGAPQRRMVQERAGDLRLRSSNALFDALFAQAVDDARLDSVAFIRDGAYNGGRPIPCDCFQTGEKWTYVWTRDLSYSSDLALAFLDPARAANSLTFKTSAFRPNAPFPAQLPTDARQIVQDTGSGGSWPVSTDRVVWAIGAEAVLANLDGQARREFAATAWQSLRGTLEADRLAAFDPADDLYSGEQSFLDWREQTYAPYVVDDLTEIARSKALSTNVAHYRALRLGARLATEAGRPELAARYAGWADRLRSAINDRFWIPDKGLYASITTADDTAAPVERFDMLGEALAILSGIADPDRAREIMAHYPLAPFGVPVYFPAQPGIPVYHNRSIWPFVTAYALQAAAVAGNGAAADHAFDSLTRAAALHLTNTENLEWLTGSSAFDDGPVINSSRQIWSVAGYLSMVARTLFGYDVGSEGVTIKPFVTAHMREVLGGQRATLLGLRYRGRFIDVRLNLPSGSDGRTPAVARVLLNGRPVPSVIPARMFRAHNVIDVFFTSAATGDSELRRIPVVPPTSHDDACVFAPNAPAVLATVVQEHSILRITLPTGPGDRVTFEIARDGQVVERQFSNAEWQDPQALTPDIRHCYRVTARYVESRLASHPSSATCVGAGSKQTASLPASMEPMAPIAFSIASAGRYEIALVYDNHAYQLNTGITNAVKRVTVLDPLGRVVATAVIQMPHIRPVDGMHPFRQSTALRATLPAGEYVLKVEDFFNMSYLQANASYAHAGGEGGPQNDADLRELVVTRIPALVRRCGGEVARGVGCE